MTTDMTVGNPLKLILTFMLPIVAGNAFQQMYSLVDTMVVGRVEGVAALAAVSAAGWLDWTVLGLALGLTQGCSILISQHFGAKDQEALRHTVGQSILLSAMTAVLLTLLAQVSVRPVLKWMNTPAETFEISVQYLRVLFMGFPLVMGYNLTASFLRAVGDSRTPLISMMIAAVMNIVLDILFVAYLGWGVAGAAGATVLSQGSSFLFNMRALKKLKQMHPRKGDLRRDNAVIGHLFRLGFPMAMASGLISVGGIMVQTVTNGYGVVFMAGVSAASRLCGIVDIVSTSLGNAMATYMGQNIGAGKLQRVKIGLRRGVQMGVGLAVLAGALLIFFGKPLMRFFVEDDPALVTEVLRIGYEYLCVMGAFLPALYMLFVYRSSLQGLGETVIPMYSGFAELGMRVLMILLLPRFVGYWGVYFAEVGAWVGAMALLMWGYYRHVRKLEKTAYREMEVNE